MNKTNEQNRALLGKRKSLKELNKEAGYLKKSRIKFSYKKSNPRSIAMLKARLKEENRLSNIIRISIFIGFTLAVGLVIYYVFFV